MVGYDIRRPRFSASPAGGVRNAPGGRGAKSHKAVIKPTAYPLAIRKILRPSLYKSKSLAGQRVRVTALYGDWCDNGAYSLLFSTFVQQEFPVLYLILLSIQRAVVWVTWETTFATKKDIRVPLIPEVLFPTSQFHFPPAAAP